jgi:hypothetical protein
MSLERTEYTIKYLRPVGTPAENWKRNPLGMSQALGQGEETQRGYDNATWNEG